MLGNNNKKILNKLAKNTLRRNKKQMSILFLTICLSAFMLFSVFTLGITYLDLGRQQDTRLNGAEYDIALMNGFTEQQKESLEENSFTRSVGTESYAGYVKSTEYDDTVDNGLLWCDQTFWEEQMAPARTKTEGFYPQEKNQLMVTKEGLKTLGKEDLQTGDSLSLTYEDNTGIHTGEFVISGIWDGYGDKAPVFVSEEFYKQSGYRLEYDGILCIKLKQDFLLPGTIDKIEDSLELSERQAFQPSPYIENSLKILAGIWGLSAVICLSAYLLIYNILYLSVSGKIRYYGLLQALGMTRKQILEFIKKQMLLISAGGIAAGIVLGILTSLILIPYVMEILGISMEDMKLSFHPFILLVSTVISGTAVFLGIRKPVGKAADTSPVEAVKYRGIGNTGPGSRRVRKKNLLWTMAWEQIRKDKKKSAVVFLSLAASLSVFCCLTTIISSHGSRTVVPNYWDADLTIRNSTQTTEEINSLKPVLDGRFLDELKKIEGIRELHMVEGAPVTFGTVISLLLLLVGALNYGNTMAASLQSRKLTFAIMESLGMSGKQIRKLLVREGLLYAFFSIVITMTAGTLITYICFQAVNYTGIPFSVPALPLVCSGGLLVILCIGVPLLSYRRLRGNPSIVERLREYEE